jgi:predicted RNase H-like HicB family nuclease
MLLTIEVFKEKNEYVAKCKELNIYSYARSSEKAVQRLEKIINFYIQSAYEYSNNSNPPEPKGNLN